MNRCLIAVTLVLVASVGAPNVFAQVVNQEPDIKAKIVLLMKSLWTWPADAAPAEGAPLKIGVLGEDPFQQGDVNHLDKNAVGLKVVVLRFPTLDKYQPCHILVVSRAADLQAALAKTQGQKVLVIAQSPGAAQQGAVMNLVVVQNKVKMEINLRAAKNAGLTPNPGLLRIAEPVSETTPS
jgi:hypothetical protein